MKTLAGKPIRVFNGAIPGGGQPQQTHVLIDFLHQFDGFIIIDGFNEMLGAKQTLAGTPSFSAFLDGMLVYMGQGDRGISRTFLSKFKSTPYLNQSFFGCWVFIRMFKTIVRAKYDSLYSQQNPLYQMYQPPSDWDTTRLDRWNIDKLLNYIKINQSLIEANGGRFLHVLQPIRWLYKDLTAEEKIYEKFAREDWYLDLAQAIDSAKKYHNIKSLSLLKIFENEKGTIYGDHIHAKKDERGFSKGRELMAEAIANEIRAKWQ